MKIEWTEYSYDEWAYPPVLQRLFCATLRDRRYLIWLIWIQNGRWIQLEEEIKEDGYRPLGRLCLDGEPWDWLRKNLPQLLEWAENLMLSPLDLMTEELLCDSSDCSSGKP